VLILPNKVYTAFRQNEYWFVSLDRVI
jgi:hypothetical protein